MTKQKAPAGAQEIIQHRFIAKHVQSLDIGFLLGIIASIE